jgi:Uma2 family endonuclease
MTAALANTYHTAEDLLTMPEGDHFELWDGELKERCMGSKSNWISLKVDAALLNFVDQRNLGLVFPPEQSLQIVPGKPNRIPRVDGAFVAKGRLPGDVPPEGHLTIAPDLVLEVVSPHDEADYLAEKTQLLLDCGVRLIWVIYPRARKAMVYRADGTVVVVREDGALDGEDVLPGFSLALAPVLGPHVPEPDDS